MIRKHTYKKKKKVKVGKLYKRSAIRRHYQHGSGGMTSKIINQITCAVHKIYSLGMRE